MPRLTHDENVRMVTALALGLAVAAREAAVAVEELIDAAGGRTDVLTAACSRVAGLPIGDQASHRRACQLLREAISHRRRTAAASTAVGR